MLEIYIHWETTKYSVYEQSKLYKLSKCLHSCDIITIYTVAYNRLALFFLRTLTFFLEFIALT